VLTKAISASPVPAIQILDSGVATGCIKLMKALGIPGHVLPWPGINVVSDTPP
jgi:hypothetical protein